jgi:hypothetical protein
VCLRKLLGIKWQDMIPDTVVLDRACIPSINTLLMKSQLRWAGYSVRMPYHRIPKIIFYSEMLSGKRSRGGQKRRFKDTLKSFAKVLWHQDGFLGVWSAGTSVVAFMHLQRCSIMWSIKKAAAELRKKKRKAKELEPLTPATIPCPHCPRLFRARIGLTGHLRVHKPSWFLYGWNNWSKSNLIDKQHMLTTYEHAVTDS